MTSSFDLVDERRAVEVARAWTARLKVVETTGTGTLYRMVCGRPNCRGQLPRCLADYDVHLYLDGWRQRGGVWERHRGRRHRRARRLGMEEVLVPHLERRPVVIESGGGWRRVELPVLVRCGHGHLNAVQLFSNT